ncbi:hypothetical protein ACJRO7_033303 [Eucalyptus globulus]|uniref:Uncharacterized protein n=1 Tax=Eucalyptus globulus TaxID=34317 RepID=A0ABD3JQZ7_EUCGL
MLARHRFGNMDGRRTDEGGRHRDWFGGIPSVFRSFAEEEDLSTSGREACGQSPAPANVNVLEDDIACPFDSDESRIADHPPGRSRSRITGRGPK